MMTRDYPAPDWRGLCDELVRELECWRPLPEVPDCLIRAREALAAEPVAEWPTGDAATEGAAELIYTQAMDWAARRPIPSGHISIPAWRQGGNSDAQEVARRTARTALARYGHQPAPPAEGDVEARNVAGLFRRWADDYPDSVTVDPHWLTRAADLLEQRYPTPVPVAERLPGPEDCDAEGRCWLHLPDMGTEPLWRLTDPSMRSRYHSHWLPATALPLPSGEVEQ